MLRYSTRNVKFKRLEPHFQLSATRSASKEGTETAVALPHSRECTKCPISALPNYGSKEKFGARAKLPDGSSCRFDGKIGNKNDSFVGNATQVPGRGEGSRLIRPAWMLCLEILNVDWTLIGPLEILRGSV